MFDRATITLGIGPHFSFISFTVDLHVSVCDAVMDVQHCRVIY